MKYGGNGGSALSAISKHRMGGEVARIKTSLGKNHSKKLYSGGGSSKGPGVDGSAKGTMSGLGGSNQNVKTSRAKTFC
jgi:hypothetical protein